jgi:DNA polymerase I
LILIGPFTSTEVRKAAFTRITKGHPWVKGEYGVHGPGAERLVEREQVINRRMLWRSIKGLRIDLEWADVYENSHRRELHTAHLIMDRAGVTLNKPASLIKVLELEGAIPEIFPRTKKTKAWSTSKDHLKLLHHPAAEAYVTAKEIEHVQNDYLGKCLELEHDGRIHPQVNILAAVTGRASMGDPPLHQFPGDARGIVLADPGDQMTSIDWSQIEPVLAANMAKDHDVLVGYESGAMDFYESIAATAMIPRKHAKVVLLAQLYGEGIKALALDLGITVEEAKELREVVYRPIPKVRKLVSNMMGIAERYKRVFTLSGRIIPIGVGKDGQVYAHTGINYLVQGSAYDTLAEALIRIEEAGLGESVYLTMHDELIVSTSASRDVRKIMTEPPERLIQLARRTPVLRTDLLDLGDRWAEA